MIKKKTKKLKNENEEARQQPQPQQQTNTKTNMKKPTNQEAETRNKHPMVSIYLVIYFILRRAHGQRSKNLHQPRSSELPLSTCAVPVLQHQPRHPDMRIEKRLLLLLPILLTGGVGDVSGVAEDSAVQERPVDVTNHGPDVAGGVLRPGLARALRQGNKIGQGRVG